MVKLMMAVLAWTGLRLAERTRLNALKKWILLTRLGVKNRLIIFRKSGKNERFVCVAKRYDARCLKGRCRDPMR